ncbi:hypothetical protein PC110_g13923 [Phytophthora cactorum]|uniref:Uncharacterized protein n=1 Tax=Phytophthora cactorum TaxID=29920 RepID=A0A329S2E8_9STRA|nr:hypothetical protein PC110_g13923 [Phytophthora cactorum]
MDSSDSDSSSSDEEELAFLVLLRRSGSQCRSNRFNFEQPASAAVWKSKFRFEKDDIIGLVMHFQLPDPFPTPQRYQVSALEALCIFLRRMAYPARLEDLEDLFGRDPTAISSISNAVLDFLYESFSHLLLFDTRRLTNATLSAYASAIYDKGAPLSTCVDFIDGTVSGMCRTKKNQNAEEDDEIVEIDEAVTEHIDTVLGVTCCENNCIASYPQSVTNFLRGYMKMIKDCQRTSLVTALAMYLAFSEDNQRHAYFVPLVGQVCRTAFKTAYNVSNDTINRYGIPGERPHKESL